MYVYECVCVSVCVECLCRVCVHVRACVFWDLHMAYACLNCELGTLSVWYFQCCAIHENGQPSGILVDTVRLGHCQCVSPWLCLLLLLLMSSGLTVGVTVLVYACVCIAYV